MDLCRHLFLQLTVWLELLVQVVAAFYIRISTIVPVYRGFHLLFQLITVRDHLANVHKMCIKVAIKQKYTSGPICWFTVAKKVSTKQSSLNDPLVHMS